MRKTTKWIAGMMGAALVLAAIAFLIAPAKADTAAAEATYKAKCAMCHGPDGKGETATGKTMKVKDFSSEEVQKMSDADLSAAISEDALRAGRKLRIEEASMAKKGGLLNVLLFSGAVIVALFLVIAPAKSQGAGEPVYKAKCASCHGADGVGATPAGKATKARDFCSDEVKKETDEEWTTIIVKGKNKMPAPASYFLQRPRM